MTITYHRDLVQGSEEWLSARCGLLTASEMKLILSPTLKTADNEKTRTHLYELLAQRISHHVEPQYVSDAMLRGQEDEIQARALYSERFAPVDELGFITNNRWGFTLGYSPDGLVGENGLIECKSRGQQFQLQTMVECVEGKTIPAEYLLQCQTGLMVAEREWLDFISYSGGLHMIVIRIYPDKRIQDAIEGAAAAFEERLAKHRITYERVIAENSRLIPTERRIEMEMFA